MVTNIPRSEREFSRRLLVSLFLSLFHTLSLSPHTHSLFLSLNICASLRLFLLLFVSIFVFPRNLNTARARIDIWHPTCGYLQTHRSSLNFGGKLSLLLFYLVGKLFYCIFSKFFRTQIFLSRRNCGVLFSISFFFLFVCVLFRKLSEVNARDLGALLTLVSAP